MYVTSWQIVFVVCMIYRTRPTYVCNVLADCIRDLYDLPYKTYVRGSCWLDGICVARLFPTRLPVDAIFNFDIALAG